MSTSTFGLLGVELDEPGLNRKLIPSSIAAVYQIGVEFAWRTDSRRKVILPFEVLEPGSSTARLPNIYLDRECGSATEALRSENSSTDGRENNNFNFVPALSQRPSFARQKIFRAGRHEMWDDAW